MREHIKKLCILHGITATMLAIEARISIPTARKIIETDDPANIGSIKLALDAAREIANRQVIAAKAITEKSNQE